MKLELTKGCVCTGISVDNTPIKLLTPQERIELRQKLCKYILEKHDDFSLFDITEFILDRNYDTYEISEPCECCGDCVETTTLELT